MQESPNTSKTGYTRVTEVLSPFSGFGNIPIHILQKAADRGTQVHTLCDAYIEGLGIPLIPENLQGYFKSFESWASDKVFFPKPARFYDDERMLTGECDAIIESTEGLILIDFKTSAQEGKTWPLQGCAYMEMAIKLGHDLKGIQFVKLQKDGAEAEVFVYDYEKHLPMWHMCLEVYREFLFKSNYNFEELL